MFASGAFSLSVLAVVVALLALRRARSLESDGALLGTQVQALSRRLTRLEASARDVACTAAAASRGSSARAELERRPAPQQQSERRPRMLH